VACSKRRSGYRPGLLAVRLSDLRAAIIIGSELTANIRALKRFQLCVLHEPYLLYSDYAFKTDFSSADSTASVCDEPAQI